MTVGRSATRMAALRRRRREGYILLPRFEISQELTDQLVDAGTLAEWDTENPDAIVAAIKKAIARFGDDVT